MVDGGDGGVQGGADRTGSESVAIRFLLLLAGGPAGDTNSAGAGGNWKPGRRPTAKITGGAGSFPFPAQLLPVHS